MYKQKFVLDQRYSDGSKRENLSKLLIIAGVHGSESNAVDIVSRLYTNLKARHDSYNTPWWKFTDFGEVTIINGVNTTGLMYGEREFQDPPSNETNDLNRYFNEDPIPNMDSIMNELEIEMNRHDVIVDVHNTPNCQMCISIACNEHATAYVDWAMRNDVKFVLSDDTPTIKRHADIDLEKIAFTLEIGDMGYLNNHDQINRECEVKRLEDFLKKVGESITPSAYSINKEPKNFTKNTGYAKGGRALKDGEISWHKICNNNEISMQGWLFRYKSITLHTDAEGIIDFHSRNPLRDFKKVEGEFDESLCSIVDPITRGWKSEIYLPPIDGWVVCVDDSYWACKDGILGEFQPYLPKHCYEWYEQEKKIHNIESKEDEPSRQEV